MIAFMPLCIHTSMHPYIHACTHSYIHAHMLIMPFIVLSRFPYCISCVPLFDVIKVIHAMLLFSFKPFEPFHFMQFHAASRQFRPFALFVFIHCNQRQQVQHYDKSISFIPFNQFNPLDSLTLHSNKIISCFSSVKLSLIHFV